MARTLMLGDLAGTGFGTVTMDLGRALLAKGEDVRFMSLNEIPAADLPEPFASRTAAIGEASGWLGLEHPVETGKRLESMFLGGLFEDGWAPDRAIILGDVASLKMSPVPQFVPDGFPAYNYVPIEGIGLPPRWAEAWRNLTPVAMSEFGATEIAKITGKRPAVVYHGVDQAVFHAPTAKTPLTRRTDKTIHVFRDRAACRKALGWPVDAVILFRADRNMPRKAYPSLLRSLAPVLSRHPEAILLWHCATVDQGGDLLDERSKYPPAIAHRMQSTGMHDRFGGVDRDVLALMYAAADIYVSNSPEGFGLTIAESLACGTPAVALDYSAVPEVVGKAGVLVPVGSYVDNTYSHFWALPNERAYGEAVSALITDVAQRKVLGVLAPMQAARFRWDAAAEAFLRIMGGADRAEVAS